MSHAIKTTAGHSSIITFSGYWCSRFSYRPDTFL